MKKNNSNDIRILSIAPSTRGFGFVVMKNAETLIEWKTRSVHKGDKSAQAIPKVKDLIDRFQPDALILPDVFEKDSRCAKWIRKFVKQVIALGKQHHLRVKLVTKKELRHFFFADEKGTKHARAKIIADRFPEELADSLPPERQAWMSEARRMDIFDAVAIALAHLKLMGPRIAGDEAPSLAGPGSCQSH